MTFSRIELLKSLVGSKLTREIQTVMEALRCGFHVSVRSDDLDLLALSRELLLEAQEAAEERFAFADMGDDTPDDGRPVVVFGECSVPSGAGFVPFQLPELEALLPGWGGLVTKILAHFGQEAFVDCFDGRKNALLKEILVRHGLPAFVDAVMFVAYTAGAAGDEDRALTGLREALESEVQTIPTPCAKAAPPEDAPLSVHAEAFFQGLLAREEPAHLSVKAALSLYVVRGLGYSISEASRMLQVSRTTIQDHLRLAKSLGLEGFFASRRLGSRVAYSRRG